MIGFFKSFWKARREVAALDASLHDLREASAKTYLAALRHDELSVGAAMRRGERIDRTPGVVITSSPAQAVPRPVKRGPQKLPPASANGLQSPRSDRASGEDDGNNFLTSFAVAEVTGSAVAGYAAGGSVGGAIAGEIVHDLPSASGD